MAHQPWALHCNLGHLAANNATGVSRVVGREVHGLAVATAIRCRRAVRLRDHTWRVRGHVGMLALSALCAVSTLTGQSQFN